MKQPRLFALVLLVNLFGGLISVRDVTAPFMPKEAKAPADWSEEPLPVRRPYRFVPITISVTPDFDDASALR